MSQGGQGAGRELVLLLSRTVIREGALLPEVSAVIQQELCCAEELSVNCVACVHGLQWSLGLAMTAFPGTSACCLWHDSVSAGLARRSANVLPCLLPSHIGVTDSLP